MNDTRKYDNKDYSWLVLDERGSNMHLLYLRTSPIMVMRWKSINYEVEWFTPPALLILRGRDQSCCILYPSSILSSIRDPPTSPSRNRRSEVIIWQQIINVETLERLPLTKQLAIVYSTTNRSILYAAARVPSLRPTSS